MAYVDYGTPPGPLSEYTEAKGIAFCEAIRKGRRPTTAAKLAGMARTSAYEYREKFPEFRKMWDDAVADTLDALEEVVYANALAGDMDCAKYWLKHYRPLIYDRDNLLKIAILQAQWASRSVGGSEIKFDENGVPVGMPASNGRNRALVILPHNGRDPHPDSDPELVAKAQALMDLARDKQAKEQREREGAQPTPEPAPPPTDPEPEPEIIPPDPPSDTVIDFAQRRWQALSD